MAAEWDVTSYAAAVAGLRERAAELADFPTRLHLHDVQPDDLLGSPRMSPAFWRYLTGSVHSSHEVRVEVVCPLRHDTTDCPRCGGLGSWVATRDVYDRPLSRALVKLAHAKSHLRPHPIILLGALLASGFDVERAAARVGIVIVSDDHRRNEEARFLSAIRALHSRYEETVLGPRPTWLDLSDSQRNAQTGEAA